MADTRKSPGGNEQTVYLLTIRIHGCPCPRNHMIVTAASERSWLESIVMMLRGKLNKRLAITEEWQVVSVPGDLWEHEWSLDALHHAFEDLDALTWNDPPWNDLPRNN